MGYHTEFEGEFSLNKKLDDDLKQYLDMFSGTRRMKWNIGAEYGLDGEFYIGHHQMFSSAYAGQDPRDTPGLIDYNSPPITQPSLWCQWKPNDDGTAIVWDLGEKFYEYERWLKYIIREFLAPNGYVLNGDMLFQGEDAGDRGIIRVVNNDVTIVPR